MSVGIKILKIMTRAQKNKEKKRSKKQINSKNVTIMNFGFNNVELIK